MAVKTQGTELYAMDPDTGEVFDVGCITSIEGIDTTIDQVETTCLNALVRTYEAGLATPGTASFAINTDDRDVNHVKLHQYKTAGKTLHWAIGWREENANGETVLPGTAPTSVTDSSGDYIFSLPDARAWIVFEGFMNSFPFSFAQNSVVTSSIGIQVSGEPQFIPRDLTS